MVESKDVGPVGKLGHSALVPVSLTKTCPQRYDSAPAPTQPPLLTRYHQATTVLVMLLRRRTAVNSLIVQVRREAH